MTLTDILTVVLLTPWKWTLVMNLLWSLFEQEDISLCVKFKVLCVLFLH